LRDGVQRVIQCSGRSDAPNPH